MIAWNRYWFGPSAYVDIAIFRCAAIGLQLILMLHGVPLIIGPEVSVDDFTHLTGLTTYPAEIWAPLYLMKFFGLIFFFEWGYRPGIEEISIIFYVTVTVGVLALIGAFTNLCLVIFATGCLFLVAFSYSFGDLHHPEAVMMFALMALAISPCGRVLSLDSWLRRLRGAVQTGDLLDRKGEFAGWAIKFIQWFYVLMYFSADFAKTVYGGANWANGFTLQYYMAADGLRLENPLAVWLSQWHYFLMSSQYLVLFFQATFVLAVIFPKTRWFYVPLGLFFHSSNWLVLGAPFPQWIVLYVVFIPWAAAFKMLQARRASGPEARSTG
jgi:hypothetical protein